MGLTFAAGDRLEVLGEVGAFGMVEDPPEKIRRVADAGLRAATRVQPRNRSLVEERQDIHGFHDWCEVPRLLPVRS